jgi:uncharacterized membrane protein YgcG
LVISEAESAADREHPQSRLTYQSVFQSPRIYKLKTFSHLQKSFHHSQTTNNIYSITIHSINYSTNTSTSAKPDKMKATLLILATIATLAAAAPQPGDDHSEIYARDHGGYWYNGHWYPYHHHHHGHHGHHGGHHGGGGGGGGSGGGRSGGGGNGGNGDGKD